MLRCLPVTLAVLCCGCSTFKWPYTAESYVIDYSRYADRGFFITESNSVNFGYTSLGSVYARVESGYEITNTRLVKDIGDDIYSEDSKMRRKVKYGRFVIATPDAAIDELYNRSVEMGADGLINIEIQPIITYVQDAGNVVTGYFASGMAIRRE